MVIWLKNNQLRFILFFLIGILLPIISLANGIPEDISLVKDTDSEYIIKKGDTLWDISKEKLSNPFAWPELWKANPHIKNPHLIFPGQKLQMPSRITKHEKEEIQESIPPSEKTMKSVALPKITLPGIPIQKKEYLVSKEVFLKSGYISDENVNAGRIAASPQKKNLLGANDYIYIETYKPVSTDEKFYIISQPEDLVHPTTKTFIGRLLRIKGIAEVIGEDNGKIKALILEAYEEISPDDMLSDFHPFELPIKPDIGRKPAIGGTIVKLWNTNQIGGNADIVYLDKGTADGMQVGDIFDIISGEKQHSTIGTIQVIRTQNNTSVAVINTASSEIKVGDLFKN